VTGLAPAAAGSDVRVEALDPVTLRGVECTQARTTAADAARQDVSRFTLTVSRPCFANLAANLGICWGATACVPFDFLPGQTVDLGRLSSQFFMPAPPEVGTGFQGPLRYGAPWMPTRALTVAGLVLSGIGLAATGG
jgi:hypothetical protein